MLMPQFENINTISSFSARHAISSCTKYQLGNDFFDILEPIKTYIYPRSLNQILTVSLANDAN